MAGVLSPPEGWRPPSVFPDNSEILWIPNEEAYGANVIPFDDNVMLARGYDVTSKLLTEKGLNLHHMDMSQFRAADGSLTCISVIYD